MEVETRTLTLRIPITSLLACRRGSVPRCFPRWGCVNWFLPFTFSLLAILLGPRLAESQVDTQLSGEFILGKVKSPRLSYGLDLEPMVLLSAPPGDPGWAALDVTPSIDYALKPWVHLTGEFLVDRTKQTNDVDSTELTPRVGLHFHLFSNFEERYFGSSEGRLLNGASSRGQYEDRTALPLLRVSPRRRGAPGWAAVPSPARRPWRRSREWRFRGDLRRRLCSGRLLA